jgi:hypothetical protein
MLPEKEHHDTTSLRAFSIKERVMLSNRVTPVAKGQREVEGIMANATMILEREFAFRLLRKLHTCTDEGPKGKSWQSAELRMLIDALERVVQEQKRASGL